MGVPVGDGDGDGGDDVRPGDGDAVVQPASRKTRKAMAAILRMNPSMAHGCDKMDISTGGFSQPPAHAAPPIDHFEAILNRDPL